MSKTQTPIEALRALLEASTHYIESRSGAAAGMLEQAQSAARAALREADAADGRLWLVRETGRDALSQILDAWKRYVPAWLRACPEYDRAKQALALLSSEQGAGDSEEPAPGDYVLATKYEDGDPGDQWAVGFLQQVVTHADFKRRFIVVDANGESFRANGFRRVEKISGVRGEWILNQKEQIEAGDASLWHYATCPMEAGDSPETTAILGNEARVHPAEERDPTLEAVEAREVPRAPCPLHGQGQQSEDCTCGQPPLAGAEVDLACLYCGRKHRFPADSNEALGVFNVFCPNGECEDRYAAKL